MNDPQPPKKSIERKSLEASAHATLGLWTRIKKVWFQWAELNQHAAWFPFLIAVIVGIDAMIVVLPGDVIVILALLSNPKAWKRTALYAGLGGAIGAFLMFLLIRQTGGAFLESLTQINDGLGANQSWERAREFFQNYGLASLAIGSVIPLLSWPPVVLAGLSSSPDSIGDTSLVLFYLLTGRLIRYFLLCYGVRYGWAFFQEVRQEAHEERARALGHSLDKDNPVDL